jgi:NarL family two-component system response regulator LiaR
LRNELSGTGLVFSHQRIRLALTAARKRRKKLIRVVIADDHHLIRQGIRAVLADEKEIEIIGEAENGQEVIKLVEELVPEVVVMDVSMPRMDGVQAAERICSMDIPTEVVILSVHDDALIVQQLLNQGIKGYLLKESFSGELVLAIRAASLGKVYLSPSVSNDVLNNLMTTKPDDLPESPAELLTPREREVLQLIAEGNTNAAVAETLTISVKTVEKHRANLMSKLDVHDLPTLIRKAIEYKLIFQEPEQYNNKTG